MWKSSFKTRLEFLDAPILFIHKDTLTPLDFDEYNEYSYYYILNNNVNILYSDKELAYVLGKDGHSGMDPFTRMPITSCYVIKIKFY